MNSDTDAPAQTDAEWSLQGKLFLDALNPRLLRVGNERDGFFFLRSDLEEKHKDLVDQALQSPDKAVLITVKGTDIASMSFV